MFALTQRMGSRIKSGSLDGFFVWNKTILFQHITNPCLLFFKQADIQKKNAWRTDGYPKKFVYQICFYEYPPTLGIRHTEIIGCYHIPFPLPSGGAILPGLLKIAHSKIFQPQNPLEDSAYSASDAFIHHRTKHDFKKIERCQHGPIPGQSERFSGTGKQTLRLSTYPPLLQQYRYWCRHPSMHIHSSPKFVRS